MAFFLSGPQFSILLSLHPASSGYKWPSSFLPPSSRLRSLLLCSNCKKNPFTSLSSSSPLSRSPRWSLCAPLPPLPPSAQQLRWECHGTWPALPPSLIDSRGSHSIALTIYHSEPGSCSAYERVQLGGCRPPSCPCQPLPRFFHPTISTLLAHVLVRSPARFLHERESNNRKDLMCVIRSGGRGRHSPVG